MVFYPEKYFLHELLFPKFASLGRDRSKCSTTCVFSATGIYLCNLRIICGFAVFVHSSGRFLIVKICYLTLYLSP